MNSPITQSLSWQSLQNDLKETSFYREEDDFRFLAIKKHTPVGSYLYLPYGPVAKDKKGFKKAIKALKELGKKEGAIFIRIEPQNPDFIKNTGENLKKVKDLSPAETWILDLMGSDDEFRSRLPSRLLRYYRNREKNGIEIETTRSPEDIKHLLNLQKALAEEKNINTFSEGYLKTELTQPFATLYLLKRKEENREEVLAAGLVFDYENTRYNLQGAQTSEGRRLHATGILTIKLIEDAREKGLKTFDFWGIAPEGAGPDHPWSGFTAFKKTFLGQEAKYAGTHDLILHPVRYKLYELLRKLRSIIR